MKKILFSLSATALALTALTAQAQERIRIGFMSPITGPQAANGIDNRDGALLAIKELNAKGLKVGGKSVQFELDINDDVADPKQGVQVAQTLADKKVKFVLGPYNSGVTVPAARVLNESEVVVLTVASNPKVTELGYNNLFRIGASDNQLGAKMATYAAQDLKVKTVAVIDDRTAYGQGVAGVFKATALQKGLTVVGEEFTNDKATDFMAILTAIKSKKPDAIFYGGLDAQAGPMLRQMEQLGLGDVKLFGGDALCTEKLAELSAKAAPLAGVTCATGGASVAKMQGGPEWKKRYDARFPGQFQIYSPYAYDATLVLIDAMKAASSTDPKVYLPALAKTNRHGVTGHIAFTAKGELTQPAVTLYSYRDGVRTPLN